MSRLRKLNRNSFPQKPCFHFQYADRQFVRVLSVPRQRAYRWKHTKYCIHCAHIGCNRWRCILLHFAASKSSVRRKCTWSRIGRSIRQQQHRRRFPSSHKIVLHTEHAVIVHHIPLHRWIINVFFLQWRYRCGIWVLKFHRLFLTCIVHYFNFKFLFFQQASNCHFTAVYTVRVLDSHWKLANQPSNWSVCLAFVLELVRYLAAYSSVCWVRRPSNTAEIRLSLLDLLCIWSAICSSIWIYQMMHHVSFQLFFFQKKKSNKLKPWMHV